MSDITKAEKVYVSTSKNGDYVSAVDDGDSVAFIRADLVPQWQPIETAPKDGREFLACYGRCNNAMHLVSYNRIHSYWQSKGEYVGGFMQNATAWCDFTPPPAT